MKCISRIHSACYYRYAKDKKGDGKMGVRQLTDEQMLLGMLFCITQRKLFLSEKKELENKRNQLKLNYTPEPFLAYKNYNNQAIYYYSDENGNVLMDDNRIIRKVTLLHFLGDVFGFRSEYSYLVGSFILGLIVFIGSLLFRFLEKTDLSYLGFGVGGILMLCSIVFLLYQYTKLQDKKNTQKKIVGFNQGARQKEIAQKKQNESIAKENQEIKNRNTEIDARNKKNLVIAQNNLKKESDRLTEKIEFNKKAIELLENQFYSWKNTLGISVKLVTTIDADLSEQSIYDCYDMVKNNVKTNRHNFKDVQNWYFDYLIEERRHRERIAAINGLRQELVVMKQDILKDLSAVLAGQKDMYDMICGMENRISNKFDSMAKDINTNINNSSSDINKKIETMNSSDSK